MAQEICALFGQFGTGGTLETGCPTTGGGFLNILEAPISSFCGFTTSVTGVPNNCWWIYTAGFGGIFPFDVSLYFIYNSIFTSKTPGSPCGSTSFSSSASNYLYICSPTLDRLTSNMEFASCKEGSALVPTFGQTEPTFELCPSDQSASVIANHVVVYDFTPNPLACGAGLTNNDVYNKPAAGSNCNEAQITRAPNAAQTGVPPAGGEVPPQLPIPGVGNNNDVLATDPAIRFVDNNPANANWNQAPTAYDTVMANTAAGAFGECNTLNAADANQGESVYWDYSGKGVVAHALRLCGLAPNTPQKAFGLNEGLALNSQDNCQGAANGMIHCLKVDLGPGPNPNKGATGTFFNPSLSAVGWGYLAEDVYGLNAFTIPVYTILDYFAYRDNWGIGGTAPGESTAVGNGFNGLANGYNWLNAYSGSPTQAGTLRQGFRLPTSSLNIFDASTVWDFQVLVNVYDSLFAVNPGCTNGIIGQPVVSQTFTCTDSSGKPLNFQIYDWMSTSHSFLANSQLTYTPPAGTTTTLRVNLRSDLHWHDGPAVTAWDVKWSYNALNATGAFQASALSVMSGIKVLGPTQLDLNLKGLGPFTELFIGSVTVAPGHVWSACGASGWNSAVASAVSANNPALVDSCIGSFTNPSICPSGVSCTLPSFDPIAHTFLQGSGAWVCENTGANTAVAVGTVGTGCSSNNTGTPPVGGTFTLTRNGCTITTTGTTCVAPATPGDYFHSSGTLALYFWTGDTGNGTNDFLNLVAAATGCLFAPVPTTGCTRWQQGIGNPTTGPVTFGQLAPINTLRFSWIQDKTGTQFADNAHWTNAVVPGIGVGPGAPTTVGGNTLPPTPILYEVGSTPSILNPASVAGCAVSYASGGGYDC
jgi:hypothetical protein